MHDQATRSEAGRFLPGRSGNPAGRPRGSRNKASILGDLIDEDDAAAIVRMMIDRALAGDWPALRICFTRLVPHAKDAPIDLDLPEITSISDAVAAGSAVIVAVGAGEITPREAQKVMAVLAAQTRNLQAAGGKPSDRSCPPRSAAGNAAAPTSACISPVVAVELEQEGERRAAGSSAPRSSDRASSTGGASGKFRTAFRAPTRPAEHVVDTSDCTPSLYPACSSGGAARVAVAAEASARSDAAQHSRPGSDTGNSAATVLPPPAEARRRTARRLLASTCAGQVAFAVASHRTRGSGSKPRLHHAA